MDWGSKHNLPVSKECPWQHRAGLAHRESHPCIFSSGERPANFMELWDYVREKNCTVDVHDERQMALFRDPRGIAVCTYYFVGARTGSIAPAGTVDNFVARYLPALCKWLAIRSIVFEGHAAQNCTVFRYEDTVSDHTRFHRQWLGSVGLNLPAEVVEGAVEAALQAHYRFSAKGVNVHSGQGMDLRARSFQNTLHDEPNGGDHHLADLAPTPFLGETGDSVG